HDQTDTLSWAEEIIVLRQGKIIQKDRPERIYHGPVDEYTAGLFGQYNLIPPGKVEPFCGLNGMAVEEGRSLLLRPEQFSVTDEEQGLRGTIKSVHYFGS